MCEHRPKRRYAGRVFKVRFLPTSTGKVTPATELTSEQTTPEGLRAAFFERTGRHAFVLHDSGLGLGLDKESFTVRLEDSGAAPAYPQLEHARAWQQPGWFGGTLGWLNEALGEEIVKLEQVSTNDLACVLRVTTEQQTVYLKTSETELEAALTAQLAVQHPDLLPNVITWDAKRSVLVTRDCGPRLSEAAEPTFWNAAVSKLAYLQRSVDAYNLQELGCPVYDFTALAARAETFLHGADTLRRWGLTGAQTSRLQEQSPRIRSAHERVSALNLPLLPAHGDAHPMNALTGYAPAYNIVWFDLSEACITQPLLDVGWFLAWLSHPARHTLPLRQAHPDAAAELWQVFLREANLPEATLLLNDVMVLALVHRALVYHERFRDFRGTVPGWRPQSTPYCLRSLLKLL